MSQVEIVIYPTFPVVIAYTEGFFLLHVYTVTWSLRIPGNYFFLDKGFILYGWYF